MQSKEKNLIIDNDGYISMSEGNNKQIMEAVDISKDNWHIPYPFIVDSVFQKFGVKNANGRIYPENILKREVEKYQQKINEHRALGECNHPAETSIDLGRVSHNIIELHWEGRTLVGKMELNVTKGFVTQGICSSLGDTVANLLINGYKIGVSSRGVGSVENRMGAMVVGNDFELICFDIVADPSTPNAYIYSKEEEKAQYIESKVNNSEKLTLSEKIKYANELLN